MKIITIMACVFFTFSLYAGTINPKVPDKEYVEYGSKFENVVSIEVKIKTKDKEKPLSLNLGSAVVIDPHWIITAAHVVDNYHSASVVIDNKNKIELNKIIIHEDFHTKQYGVADIALGYSKDKITMSKYPELYQDDDEVGKKVSIIGYGFTARMADRVTELKYDEKKRGGTNIIQNVYSNLLICDASKKDPTKLEFLICSGDSGGGLFIDDKLAGINSCVLSEDKRTDSSYGDESGHTRISKLYPWIMKKINDE